MEDGESGVGVGDRLDPLPPGPHDRGLDDLLNLRLGRVVGARHPTALVGEGAREEAAEDGGLDVVPVGARGGQQESGLAGVQLDARRSLEQSPVDVGRALEGAATGTLACAVEPLEQLAEHVIAARPGICPQPLGRLRHQQLGEHPEVLGKAAPGDLQREVAGELRVDSPFGERDVETRDRVHGLLGKVDRVDGEVRRAAAQEVERLDPLGKLIEHEVDPRRARTVCDRHWKRSGLPDHEPVERAEHDITGRANPLLGEARADPVVEDLPPVGLRQPLRRGL